MRPHRSQSYYFADPVTSVDKRKLEIAALTGNQVLARSNSSWPGSAYTWKVLHLPPSGLTKDLKAQTSSQVRFAGLLGDKQEKKRTRPGKKYRIKLRKRSAASAAKKDAKKAAAEAKEAAEREKRTRRNREKKVKRKAKEKAKKEGVEDDDGEAGTGDDAMSVG